MATAQVTFTKRELLENSDGQTPFILFGVSWDDYEKISDEFGESNPFHITFNKGILTIMPVTKIHELLASLLHDFIRSAGLFLKLNVIASGKATMRSQKKEIGCEPDASYYIQKANRFKALDFVPNELDLPPDIVVEIDVHHPSNDKFAIYAEFGVPEFWQYDGERVKIFKLQESGEYGEIERSEQLPILTSEMLTEFLRRGLKEEQFAVLTDFQKQLQENE